MSEIRFKEEKKKKKRKEIPCPLLIFFISAPAVYSPGTDDYGYGYANSVALSSSQAVLNADSYALYANGMR